MQVCAVGIESTPPVIAEKKEEEDFDEDCQLEALEVGLVNEAQEEREGQQGATE